MKTIDSNKNLSYLTVKGTIGYKEVVSKFVESTFKIPFEELHRDFLEFFPQSKSLILDLGAGFGRDAHEFCLKGHSVVAVEPLSEFRVVGKQMYKNSLIKWLDDSLPELDKVKNMDQKFDLIFSSGVWHHLNEEQQRLGLKNVFQLLKPNGIVALSLRNGPAGAGSHVFPINVESTLKLAQELGFEVLKILENQPSLMLNKTEVKWSKLVLKKSR